MSQELKNRFLGFAIRVRDFCRKLKQEIINSEYIRQLIRSSGSVGASYIDASDDLGQADERMKLKVSHREAKESLYWLNLVLLNDSSELEMERAVLIDECIQIKKNVCAIIQKLG